MKQVIIYLPVIHAGYDRFLKSHASASEFLILGEGFRAHYSEIGKDIRALQPSRAASYLRAMFDTPVRIVQPGDLRAAVTADVLVAPAEDLMRSIVSDYALDEQREVVFDRTFLRWDRAWSLAQRPAEFQGETTRDEVARHFLLQAKDFADRSSDWWRQVGALAVLNGEVLCVAWNQHYPTPYSPYIDGDPRDAFSRGDRADLSTAIHAEAAVVAKAARSGQALLGADLYSTTFPCPSCARLIAQTGFRRCYFANQYSVLDGDRILRAANVELIYVDLTGVPVSAGPQDAN